MASQRAEMVTLAENDKNILSWRFWLFQPVLATLLRQPGLWWIILGLAILQVGLSWLQFPMFRCPAMQTLGLPCPGCGLTRAVRSLIQGRIEESLQFHLFAAVALFALAISSAGCMLPPRWRESTAHFIERIEVSSGISQIVFLLLWIYWVSRLLFLPDQILLLRTTM